MEKALKPLKRQPELVPLSREHHFGLLFSWKIKQGIARQADHQVLRNYVGYFWNHNLREHLEKEEAILQQILPVTDKLRGRVMQEHALIRSLVGCLETEPENPVFLLETLQTFLKDHIRFEERIFFPYLEQQATPEQLQYIGLLTQEHAGPPTDDFEPAFWAA